MGRKRTYQGVDIKALDVARLLAVVAGAAVVVSIDVAKAALAAAISTQVDGVIRIVRFEHPTETRTFLDLVASIRAKVLSLTILMEPTGTYGDALRYQLKKLDVEVRMIQPRRTHDAKAAFDGVSSKHDNKDAVTMTKLHREGASATWRELSPERRTLRALIDQFAMHERACEVLQSQIEAKLARHWPEFEQWLSIRKHKSGRMLLAAYLSPQRVAADPEGARALLVRASRGALSPELIGHLVDSAKTTLGIPMVEGESVLMSDLLAQLHRELDVCDEIEKRIESVFGADATIARIRPIIGIAAAAAVVTYMGLPADYRCSRAFLKAAGLNMRESSSGTEKGALHITKQGPSMVRRLLYLATLRLITNDPVARAWYQARGSYSAKKKTAAVVALMRKLCAAVYRIAKDNVPYDATKLFDTRRLTLTKTSETAARGGFKKRRTQPSSIARRGIRARRTNAGGAST